MKRNLSFKNLEYTKTGADKFYRQVTFEVAFMT
jgi:hypothetical protein